MGGALSKSPSDISVSTLPVCDWIISDRSWSIFPLYIDVCVWQCKGRRGVRWEDPTSWVVAHLPWSDHPGTTDCPALLRLRAEDLGCEAPANVGHQSITATDRQLASGDFQSASDTADPLVSIRYSLNLDTRHISNSGSSTPAFLVFLGASVL